MLMAKKGNMIYWPNLYRVYDKLEKYLLVNVFSHPGLKSYYLPCGPLENVSSLQEASFVLTNWWEALLFTYWVLFRWILFIRETYLKLLILL